jgi:hypothetical protein
MFEINPNGFYSRRDLVAGFAGAGIDWTRLQGRIRAARTGGGWWGRDVLAAMEAMRTEEERPQTVDHRLQATGYRSEATKQSDRRRAGGELVDRAIAAVMGGEKRKKGYRLQATDHREEEEKRL